MSETREAEYESKRLAWEALARVHTWYPCKVDDGPTLFCDADEDGRWVAEFRPGIEGVADAQALRTIIDYLCIHLHEPVAP